MSKSTQRYGKLLYSMSTSIDGSPKPSEAAQREAKRLDDVTAKLFGDKGINHYAGLSDADKTAVHLKINEERQKNRERKDKVA